VHPPHSAAFLRCNLFVLHRFYTKMGRGHGGTRETTTTQDGQMAQRACGRVLVRNSPREILVVRGWR
jgi:hypothetical protein